ncbi:MAG: hypothetical protein R3300_04315 [Candidatus Promineifilaceae bacterium]|nr:hypothetical protein [Candidatus Promineifilaceae bacterium]
MRSSLMIDGDLSSRLGLGRLAAASNEMPRQLVIGAILVLALFAFELFNFDTTRYALASLLGEVSFAGLKWATILAVAFCAIDFAGLARLFTPERGRDEPKEIWYLTGAWLLGATMNAVMTWWAVSLTLLNHDLGNEVLTREQLLVYVPVFVAVLVWLTRILFIGAVTMAGERILAATVQPQPTRSSMPRREKAQSQKSSTAPSAGGNLGKQASRNSVDLSRPARSNGPMNSRVRQRPPRPASARSRPARFKSASASTSARNKRG